MENVAAEDETASECEWEEFDVELRASAKPDLDKGDPDAEPDLGADEDLDLGPCCACRQSGKTVRNLLMLPWRLPAGAEPVQSLTSAGTDLVSGKGGWGCFVCHLPCEGAVAVLCDRCRAEGREVLDVCDGFPALGRRTLRAGLTEPWDHDYALHPETWQEEAA